ncbi:MAG: DUF4131 domain-containing protein [Phycisphaera sp.]|nr:DUF4131 domain-containing protein [Phycisphaera sp.]
MTHTDESRDSAPLSPVLVFSLLWLVGTALGLMLPVAGVWLTCTAVALVGLFVPFTDRNGWLKFWVLLMSVVLAAASWASVNSLGNSPSTITPYLTAQSRPARCTGVVENASTLAPAQRSVFARYLHQSPVTYFVLDLREVDIAGSWQPMAGRVLVKIEQADAKLSRGQRVEVTGWLSAFDDPGNPGEEDYKLLYARRGIAGRMTLPTRGNCRLLEPPTAPSVIDRVRGACSGAASWSLKLGMDRSATDRNAFLNLVLLGQRQRDTGELREAFRRVGLSHILALSGAHLAILLGMCAAVVRLLCPNPPRAATVLLVILLAYLCAVPMNTPIVRAGIMAGFVFIGWLLGTKLRAIDMLGLAMIVVLIIRPQDAGAAGFQLSFGVVAALLLFTKPLTSALWPEDETIPNPTRHTPMRRALRWAVAFLAANVVAFCAAMPLVAYHFQLVNPLAVLMGVVSMPFACAVIGLGYVKIVLGLVLPSAGMMLSAPLAFASDLALGGVRWVAQWQAAGVELRHPVPISWTVTTLVLFVAVGSGLFRRRRGAMVVAMVLCLAWLCASQRQPINPAATSVADPPVARLNMFDVGNGSCFLLRIDGAPPPTPPGQTNRGYTLMFDCGSAQYLDVGRRSVVPALRELGVDKIDTVMLSHADLDHYCGLLDVVDAIQVGRVLAPRAMVDESQSADDSSTATLARELWRRGHALQPAAAGWHTSVHGVELDLLWPPERVHGELFHAPRDNDGSLVLSVRVAGRRILLNGDIQDRAMSPLLGDDPAIGSAVDLRADVTDLPHHGSFGEQSVRWLDAVQPSIVLQSSDARGRPSDPWRDVTDARRIERLVSGESGMVEVCITSQGKTTRSTFKSRDTAGR